MHVHFPCSIPLKRELESTCELANHPGIGRDRVTHLRSLWGEPAVTQHSLQIVVREHRPSRWSESGVEEERALPLAERPALEVLEALAYVLFVLNVAAVELRCGVL